MAFPSAVLCDLDGTLLNTEPLYYEAYARLAEQFGVGPYTPAFHVQHLLGRPEAIGAAAFVRELKVPGLDAAGLLHARDAVLSFASVAPLPGASVLAASLSKGGLPCAIVTASQRSYVNEKARATPELFACFGSHVFCGDDAFMTGKRGKPSPDIYLAAAAALGVRASDCIVIEDSLAGVAAGVAAGAFVVCVPDARIPRAEFVAAGAHLILGSLDELGDVRELAEEVGEGASAVRAFLALAVAGGDACTL